MAQNREDPSSKSTRARSAINRGPSSETQEIFMLPRQKSRSRDRRESRVYLVDGQICWTTSDEQQPVGYGSARHSSVGLMFGSSVDLSLIGQSIDSSGGAGSGSEEAISYRIKWCRENIVQLKRQTWPMEKKLQVLKASKLFIKQHQGELKQSKQAKDVIASTSAIFERYWRHFKREFANFLVIITPWEMRIKKIESHFGSVVASYFTFLRWIFWLNLANSLVMVAFVMVPELIENAPDRTGMRKGELGMQQLDGRPAPAAEFNPTLGEMWEFEGFLKFSPIFYGYYSNVEMSRSGFWRNPLAFLLSAMITYLFCFFCISRKLSQNTKQSRIGSKDDEYTFCWTVFVGWDFMIGNSETAYNKTSSLVMNLKEGILEEKEQTKDRDWKLILRRVFANLLTLMLIVASAYVVTLAVQRSENLPEDASLLQKNELQLVMSGIQFMFPPLFDVIGNIEKYHPRKALSWQLGRILFLDFLNFYTLMFSLFGTVDQMSNQLNEVSGNITLLRRNETYFSNLFTTPPSLSSTESSSTVLTPATVEPTTVPVDFTNLSTSVLPGDTSTFVQEGLNVSTLLTSVLLASSTMMPSNASTTLADLSTLSSIETITQTTANYTLLPSTSTSMEPSTAVNIVSTTLVAEITTSTTLAPSTQQSAATSTKAPEDEDYPDLGELLKVASKRQQLVRRSIPPTRARAAARRESQKNRRRTGVPEQSADDAEVHSSDDSFWSREVPSRRTFAKQSSRPVGAFIPPIQDPYLNLGRKQWLAAAEVAGVEEDEEEPLEGRLEASKSTTSSSRRPIKVGFPRPVDSSRQPTQRPGSRIQATTVTSDDGADDNTEESTVTSTVPARNQEQAHSQANSSLASGEKPAEIGPAWNPQTAVPPESSTLGTDGPSPTIASATDVAPASHQEQPQGKSGLSEIAELATPPSERVDPTDSSTELPSTSSCGPQIGWPKTTSNASEPLTNGTSLVFNLKSSSLNASDTGYSDCAEIPEFKHQELLALNDTLKDKLKSLCWETMFGQEMVKIVVMDLVMTVISAISFEFMRACFVRYCNRFFFWDLERGFPGYQDFKIAENVLHLVNNQSTVWMGMFFAPGLPAINTVKLAVLMYVRSWAVLTCNIPHETVFKVSKSNNFYYWILLINLLICILPVAYAVTWIRPSWHCGPFGGECRMYIVVTKLIKSLLPPEANSVFRYLTSPGAVIPILISLILIIYYLASTVSSSKEANKELKAQLKKDKEQEAAVPEITNTAVADPSPAVTAPLNPTIAATSASSAGLSLPASTLAPQTESRPKSLLTLPPV